MEELLARHRKEQRDLQGRITNKKKNATKKNRKGVNDECETLERELKERQMGEVAALSADPGTGEDRLDSLGDQGLQTAAAEPSSDLSTNENISERVNVGTPNAAKQVSFDDAVSQAEPVPEPGAEGSRAKKPNRQKARLARRAEAQAAAAEVAAQEAANIPDRREQEITSMQKQIEAKGLQEIPIRPDGHCLYSACAHSLASEKVKQSGPYSAPYQNVRFTVSDFISSHRGDFEPFLDEPFEVYVKKIKNTAEWGGQLELQAIAKVYGVEISVLRADGSVTKIENSGQQAAETIWLAYYEHSFGLGEHYNALTQKEPQSEEIQ